MISFKLINQKVRDRAKIAIQEAPEGWQVTIQEPKRNLEQNARLHALLGEISRSGKQWAGKERTIDEWKTLFVSGFMYYNSVYGDTMAGIEDEAVRLVWRTSSMSKSKLSELIEYIEAWWAENKEDL